MRRALVVVLGCAVIGGCPMNQQPPDDESAVSPVLSISSTRGAAPLRVTVSAGDSTSTNEGDLKFRWDFDDGTRSTEEEVTHTYTEPGRYTIELRVTDAAGEVGMASQDVRVAGTSATAVITSDISSGPAPLTVQFSGRDSAAENDTILDYFWDFDDGEESRLPEPSHRFSSPGVYEVTLRVVSAGGVEATTSTIISVGQGAASLQFSGGQFANLPVRDGAALAQATVEAWFKADAGGSVFSIGTAALVAEVVPGSNRVSVRAGAEVSNETAGNLGGVWRHLAVVYNGATATVFLDGVAIGSVPLTGNLAASQVVLGTGFGGKVAEVRIWSTARTAQELLANMNHRLVGNEAGLLDYWPLDDGTGQTLRDLGPGGTAGTLGASGSAEASDPAWSTDGPPL